MISILMPIYNGIEFINDSITSVLMQTNEHWELIIGINGHLPNSDIYKRAKEYETIHSNIKVFDLIDITGKSNALNKMLDYCSPTSSYIALLDVDDIWHYKKLEVQWEYLHKYDVIGTRCVWFGDREGTVPSIPVHDISDFNFAQVNPIINSSVIIRKELCHWDQYWNLEDYDLWIRLRKQHKRFYNCPEVLVKHRIHNQSAFNAKGNHRSVDTLLKFHGLI